MPRYIALDTLPFASDIFYHGHLWYSRPTGFTPDEVQAVASFPEYCVDRGVPLPSVVWHFCTLYFRNTEQSILGRDMLEPLRPDLVSIYAPVYDRNRPAVDRARSLLAGHPRLREAIQMCPFHERFIARELLSHVFFGLQIEEGREAAVHYLRENTASAEHFLNLCTAVVGNRLLVLSRFPKLLVFGYEHEWRRALWEASEALAARGRALDGRSIPDADTVPDVEWTKHRIFDAVLTPIFGRCDTTARSEAIAKVARSQQAAIASLKQQCEEIATEMLFHEAIDPGIRQRRLQQLVRGRILDSVADLVGKRTRDVKAFLADALLDSTLIGGLLAFMHQPAPADLGVAASAAVISSAVRSLYRRRREKPVMPSTLIVRGMRQMRLSYEQMEAKLGGITIGEVTPPTL